ncbi:MAG: hypothetical protein GXY52_01485 [Chloroflexi bacterium]|nr:hypothetical protein [Chloroflexota bacterium]
MSDQNEPTAPEALQRIIDSARRLGVQVDESAALQWLTAMAAMQDHEITVDETSGVYGLNMVMLDFSPTDLEHFKRIGKIVEFDDEPGVVETALALSGSAAQSKIQTYPGDADYFERVNIIAPTREEATRICARIMREKALSSLKGPDYQLIEVKFGSYPDDCMRDGAKRSKGSPISWGPSEIEAGQIEVETLEGQPATVTWDDVAHEPGWCKLDWVVADSTRGQLANASNMLDVTWEAPDGKIVPLDGYLDPYFQEVYLQAESVPIFTKLSKQVSGDALDHYVKQLEGEILKYLKSPKNYGKVAKRMYNIFRLTGRYHEAVFLRELFDEPTTILYQVWSLIQTLDDWLTAGAGIEKSTVIEQCDKLILAVIDVLEGAEETEIVRHLLRLRSALEGQQSGEAMNASVTASRAEVINIVNNFFYEKLSAVPEITAYMDSIYPSEQE